MTEWIAVSERLPEPSRLMILYGGRRVFPGWLRSDHTNPKLKGKWHDMIGVVTTEVTHWMPLPPPPEGNV